MPRQSKYEGTPHERKIKSNNEWIKKNMKQLNIKMSPNLYESIKKEAKRRHRSIRNFCIFAITEQLKIVDKTETINENE